MAQDGRESGLREPSLGRTTQDGVVISPFAHSPDERRSLLPPTRRSMFASSNDASMNMRRMRTTMAGNLSPGENRSSMFLSSNDPSDFWDDDDEEDGGVTDDDTQRRKVDSSIFSPRIRAILGQIPSIALIAIFHLMIGLPFGVSYFPISWGNQIDSGDGGNSSEDSDIGIGGGPFPLPGKETLGIRMFLFSTIIGQLAFTFTSGFTNPIGLQMVENVPFYHALAAIVISHQGYGIDALSTLIFIFGLSSVVVGVVFFLLGHFELGRIVYFFPNHVLVGCIGGIGIFIAKTGTEVAMNDSFSIGNIFGPKSHLIIAVALFESVLRVLEQMTKDSQGNPKYTLLSPIYFLSITPIFYIALWIIGSSVTEAEDAGYFFPRLDEGVDAESTSGSFISSLHLHRMFEMWDAVDLPSISWAAVADSLTTIISLSVFSLIHVPINIPAFALSTDKEVDMNEELKAHGYSNACAGLCGGLQNYMAYTQSLLYARSGGDGRASGISVAIISAVLFAVGPKIATVIPRCMAGTLLVHVGLDLFLEGVYDSWHSFDKLEYAGIWLIVVVMTLMGMDAALVAGVISAVCTFALQSIQYPQVIRGSMKATTLRSSFSYNQMNRPMEAQSILDSPIAGRSRIEIVQFQGHLFFGNMAALTKSLNEMLSPPKRNDNSDNEGEGSPRGLKRILAARKKKRKANEDGTPQLNDSSRSVGRNSASMRPLVVIFDFSLVQSIDSSAAAALVKFKNTMIKKYGIQLCVFVSGSEEGFPTAYRLSQELSSANAIDTFQIDEKKRVHAASDPEMASGEATSLLWQTLEGRGVYDSARRFRGSHVRPSLDEALVLSENYLISRENPSLLDVEDEYLANLQKSPSATDRADEGEAALHFLSNIASLPTDDPLLGVLISAFQREEYSRDAVIWKQGSISDCAKLVLSGALLAVLEEEAGTTERIPVGSMIGELGLVQNVPRLSSVLVQSNNAVLMTLSREAYDRLADEQPQVANLINKICIKYLFLRVQNVSNRVFETRCLPI